MERDNRGGKRFGDRRGGRSGSFGNGNSDRGPRERDDRGGKRFGDRRGGRSGGFGKRSFDRGPREMHKATCSECQQECEVPFKPSGERPVYCRECFRKKREY